MCGIAGIISEKRNVRPLIQNMVSMQVHRGPDFQSYFVKDNIALGHARLSIIDLHERSNQPMHDETKQFCIIFNGEIYNYRELKKELVSENITFNTESDTEVILNGYIKYGFNYFKKLRGFFSFCILDRKKQNIILSRDQFGKKPLYYSLINSEFIFSSEISPIINILEKKNEPEYIGLSHFLWKGHYAHGHSAISNIKTILPGEILTYNILEKKISKIQTKEKQILVVNECNEERSISKLKESLIDSLQYRFVSDVPVAFLLSGGVDSSLLSVLAGKHLNEKFDTFYLGYDDGDDIYRDIAKKVSDSINSSHHSLTMKTPEISKVADKMIDIFGEPFSDYSALPSYDIYKYVSNYAKVVIAGDGADEIFGGYKDIKTYLLFDKVSKFFPFKKINNIESIYRISNNSKFGKLMSYLSSPLLLDTNHFSTILFSGGWNIYYRKEYMTEYGWKLTGEANLEEQEIMLFSESGKNTIEKYLNYYLYRLIYDFMVKVDRTSMANSVEVRSPYLDKFMIEENNPINITKMSDQFDTKKELKYFLKEEGYSYVTNIKKAGFTPPLRNWMKSETCVKLLDDIMSDKESIIYYLFKVNKLREMYKNKKLIDRNFFRLWNLIILHNWFKRNY